MPRGYRLLIVALVAWLGLASAQPPNNGAKSEQAKSAPTIDQSLDRIAGAQIKQADPGEYEAPCAEGEENNKSDLCAQWYAARAARDAADWAAWGFWLGLAGTVGLVFNLIYTRKAVLAAEDATKDADRALEIAEASADASVKASQAMIRQTNLMAQAQRPWLDFEIVGAHSGLAADRTSVVLELKISNASDFPAHEVQGIGFGHFCAESLLDPLSLKSRMDETKAALDVVVPTRKGEAVFPRKETTPLVSVTIYDPECHRTGQGNAMIRATVGIRYVFDGGVGYTFRDYFLHGAERALDMAAQGKLPHRDALNYPTVAVTIDSASGRAL